MSEFQYILDKIDNADYVTDPFTFLYIEDFLSEEHFDIVTQDQQINLKEVESTEELVKTLQAKGYKPVPFPGCTTDVNEYVKWYNNGAGQTPAHAQGLIEGFGMSFRMMKYNNPTIESLINFLNSDEFYTTILTKFGKSINRENTYVETTIQKYVSGYEISPHPDIRKKVLTYMLNINPSDQAESMGLQTDFLKFIPRYEHIYEIWNKDVFSDRFWVPWDWCETVFKQVKNNSITMFAPSNDTLHAVKLDYDHCKTQRTQVYGNVWLNKTNVTKRPNWRNYRR